MTTKQIEIEIPPIQLGEYITRTAHHIYPVGSKCTAYRKYPNILVLKMEDGVELELDGNIFYCKGLEYQNPIMALYDRGVEEIIAEEDARVFKGIYDK